MCFLSKLFGQSGKERPSPQDWLPRWAVKQWALTLPLEQLPVRLTQPPAVWVPYIPDTNSMDGVFDYGNNNILIQGTTEADMARLVNILKVGDIAVYRKAIGGLVIHRIIKISRDSVGRYFTFKGDNNITKDKEKVREKQVEWISVGTIY